MNYTILVHPAEEGGYWTEVPALPGCFSQGDTVEEAIEYTRDAIELFTEALREDGVQVTGDDGFLIAHVSIAA
jgi:predicted RNase H-like HicB family nuclease